jgi:RHS repeat-associated protein
VAIERGGRYYYVLRDRLGSTWRLVDERGNVAETYDYEDFGSDQTRRHSIANSHTFTGQYFDDDSSLVYLRARWYDPETGRFITRDPLEGDVEDPRSFNPYAYCNNDPVNFTDLDGHNATLAIPLGAAAGAISVPGGALVVGGAVAVAGGVYLWDRYVQPIPFLHPKERTAPVTRTAPAVRKNIVPNTLPKEKTKAKEKKKTKKGGKEKADDLPTGVKEIIQRENIKVEGRPVFLPQKNGDTIKPLFLRSSVRFSKSTGL